MIKFLARRIAGSLPLLVIVSFAVFVLIDLVPGDAAFRFAGDNPSPELVEQIRRVAATDRSRHRAASGQPSFRILAAARRSSAGRLANQIEKNANPRPPTRLPGHGSVCAIRTVVMTENDPGYD